MCNLYSHTHTHKRHTSNTFALNFGSTLREKKNCSENIANGNSKDSTRTRNGKKKKKNHRIRARHTIQHEMQCKMHTVDNRQTQTCAYSIRMYVFVYSQCTSRTIINSFAGMSHRSCYYYFIIMKYYI